MSRRLSQPLGSGLAALLRVDVLRDIAVIFVISMRVTLVAAVICVICVCVLGMVVAGVAVHMFGHLRLLRFVENVLRILTADRTLRTQFALVPLRSLRCSSSSDRTGPRRDGKE